MLRLVSSQPLLLSFELEFRLTVVRNCVTGAAAGTNGQPSPWLIAKSFEMYAYAARAIGTKFCTVDIHSVDDNALGGIVGG